MGHEPADEMHIAAETVQLGDGHMALELLRSCESGLELRTAVEGVGTLARLNLNELADQLQTLRTCKLEEGLPLSFDSET